MYNDALDDPLLEAGTRIFSGLREGSSPSLILGNHLLRAENLMLGTQGTARTRPGTDWLAQPQAYPAQGMWFYDIPGFERLIVVSNGKVYELAGTAINTTATEITGFSPALSTTAPISFAQLVDKLYIADGANYYELYWDGLVWQKSHQATFSGGATLADFSILLVVNVGGASFRVIGTGINTTDNDLLYVSDPLAGKAWNSANNVRVGRGDGDPIRMVLASQDGRLTVCKEKSFWRVDPVSTTLAQWTMGAINESIGTLAGRTCINVGGDVYALTSRGVLSLGALSTSDAVNESAIVSTEIQDTLKRLNTAAAGKSWATTWDDYYLLAIPLDAATTPNAILAYNVVTRKWSGHWTGLTPTCAAQTRFSDDAQTILADSAGRLLRLSTAVKKDQTSLTTFAEIAALLETKAWNFRLPRHPKQLFTAEVQFEDSTGTVDVELISDGRSPVMIEEDARTNQLPILPVQLPFSLEADAQLRTYWHLRNQPTAREARLRITATQGYLKIREIRLQGWPDTPRIPITSALQEILAESGEVLLDESGEPLFTE
jgi:hypothetical protein